MRIFSWDDVLNSNVKNFIAAQKRCGGSALTVGGFDGPHRGHEVLCSYVTAEAQKRALMPGLITFRHSPRSFKQKTEYEGDISTVRLRLEVLEEWGFAFAVVIDFSSDFSKIQGIDFLHILKDSCAMCFFAVGKGFRCGRDHAVGESHIRGFADENGIECAFIPPKADSGSRISSSAVRRCVREGRLDKAARLLGRPFEIDCVPFTAETKGENTLLYPCAEQQQVLPPDGVYAVQVFAALEGSDICFDTDLHTDTSVLRPEVPAVYKNCRFDKIRFKI